MTISPCLQQSKHVGVAEEQGEEEEKEEETWLTGIGKGEGARACTVNVTHT
jgi:hypothetical protein